MFIYQIEVEFSGESNEKGFDTVSLVSFMQISQFTASPDLKIPDAPYCILFKEQNRFIHYTEVNLN